MLPLIKGGGRSVLNWAKYLERVVKERVKGKTLGSHTFARRYYNFASIAFYTLLDRYSKITLGSNDPLDDLICTFESFCTKFCVDFTLPCYDDLPVLFIPEHPLAQHFAANCGPRTHAMLRYIQASTSTDDLNHHYFEYMKALQSKNLPSDMYQKEFDEFSMYIDFFSKRQAKPDIRAWFEERQKAGQGVHAFQKHLNALLAPYSRMLAEILHKILLPNVIFASNTSDAIIGAKIAEYYSEALDRSADDIDHFACDFTEYDSSQYELSPCANSIFMLFFGAPTLLVDLYINMRHSWCVCDDMMRLYGHDKMHSGEPFTLVGNTLFGMLVIAEAVDFDELFVACFKGDDSGIIGRNVAFNNRALQWCASRGLILKDEYPRYLEFTGMFVTPYGYFPDVVRKAVKFMSTVFRDRTHYNQAVISLDADLCCITSQEHLFWGAMACSQYYNDAGLTNGISFDHVLLLTSWLQRQTKVPFQELNDVDLEVLNFFADDNLPTITT